jgi:Raf kinase inhibitor-like YbhB/YbcL family protein
MEVSSVFVDKSKLLLRYTCDGEGINPPLNISNFPSGTVTLAIVMDDPDASAGTFVHWVLFNIPIFEKIEENFKSGIRGINSAGKLGYFGPCPPSGAHRYFFKVYALDSEIRLREGASKEELEEAMKNHILESAELMGLYR